MVTNQDQEEDVMQLKTVHPALVCFGAIILLDIYTVFETALSPDELGAFACAAIPYANVSGPLVSEELTSFATTQCGGAPNAQAISIIFFMLKIVLIYMAVVATLLELFISLERFQMAKQTFFDKMDKAGGGIDALRNSGATILGVAMFALYQLITLEKEPMAFGTNIFNKFAQDFSCLTVFLALCGALSNSLFYVLYQFKQRKKTN